MSPKPQRGMIDIGPKGIKGSHTFREAKLAIRGSSKKGQMEAGVIGFTLKNSKKSSDAG